jgi:hypothetical protein
VTKPMQMIALAAMFSLTLGSAARGQDKPDKASAAVTPVKLQVVVSRYQGEKKISSMPYTLSVNAGATPNSANIRMGTKIPIATAFGPEATGPDAKPAHPLSTFNYQDVGTNIDCNTSALEDGRFRVQITVDDSSVYPDDQGRAGGAGHPSFRSFRANSSMLLKDGQTAQITTATDKLTGETVRVDVTLTIVK